MGDGSPDGCVRVRVTPTGCLFRGGLRLSAADWAGLASKAAGGPSGCGLHWHAFRRGRMGCGLATQARGDADVVRECFFQQLAMHGKQFPTSHLTEVEASSAAGSPVLFKRVQALRIHPKDTLLRL